MKYSFVGVIIWGIVLLIGLAVIAGFITLNSSLAHEGYES